MGRWTGSALVQVMACRLFGTKPLPEPMLNYYQFNPQQQTSAKLEPKYILFIDENALENVVCEMAVILYWEIWVNVIHPMYGKTPTQIISQYTWNGHTVPKMDGHDTSINQSIAYILRTEHIKHPWISLFRLLDKMAAIPQTIFSGAFSWMKCFLFWLKFHWSLFL